MTRHKAIVCARVQRIIVACTAVAAFGAVAQSAAAQPGPDLERGHAVYDYWCAPCHAPGPGHPGTQSLNIKYNGSLPAVLEERDDLTPELVKTMVREGILLMAPYRKTEISDSELDDLAAYLTR